LAFDTLAVGAVTDEMERRATQEGCYIRKPWLTKLVVKLGDHEVRRCSCRLTLSNPR
jgi:carbamoylphosphate synthase large subunit